MIRAFKAFLPFLIALGVPAGAVAAPCPAGMPVEGSFSSGFGLRHGRPHPGVDIRAPVGTPVRAAAGGTVVFAGRYFDYGLMVEVQHADGTRARYAHLAGFAPGVTAGAVVADSRRLGQVGRTGRTTGANLHVELLRGGRAVDPWPWLTLSGCTPATEVAEAPLRR